MCLSNWPNFKLIENLKCHCFIGHQDDIDAAKKEFDKKMMKAKEGNEAEGKATEGDDEQNQGTSIQK